MGPRAQILSGSLSSGKYRLRTCWEFEMIDFILRSALTF